MRNTEDKVEYGIKGEVVDSILDTVLNIGGKDVKLKAGEEYKIPKSENLVLRSATEIISSLLKGGSNFYENTWWEVGSGSDNWDDSNLPSPTLSDKGLLKPTFRKKIQKEDIKFLDSEGKYVENVTNKIEMTSVFGLNEANGYLREFSIYFGGDKTLSSGLPFNRKIHGVIYKTESIELKRKIHFTVNLSTVK